MELEPLKKELISVPMQDILFINMKVLEYKEIPILS